MLRSMEFTAIISNFVPDHTIEGKTSGALAYVDKIDGTTVWYHQTQETGFKAFIEGETVEETDGSGAGVLEAAGIDADSYAYIEPDIDPFSGDILYIENRAAIARAAGQIEDIKIIVQL